MFLIVPVRKGEVFHLVPLVLCFASEPLFLAVLGVGLCLFASSCVPAFLALALVSSPTFDHLGQWLLLVALLAQLGITHLGRVSLVRMLEFVSGGESAVSVLSDEQIRFRSQ